MLSTATVLALTHRERDSRATPSHAALLAPDDSVRPALVRALLDDAMLTMADMPDGWTAAAPDARRSPLARRYGERLIGESCARFVTAAGGARFAQHVGILPRAAAESPDETDHGECDRLRSRRDHRARRHTGDALRGEDVLLFRRGQLVMALVRRVGDAGAGRDDETTTAGLRAVVRWTALADALA